MLYEKIPIDGDAYIEAYVADRVGNFLRNALLVIPGGGYSNVCSDREGEPIAQALYAVRLQCICFALFSATEAVSDTAYTGL